ncbi:hypothetical protein [Paludifilum halophilum]|uniref:hypothetical protein n=1 Tax=Paludifilum halophilum TaxID=1642702 RepID=UPI00146F205C|nr:hypothetical protein [Paludifilum halophilum]
MAKFANITGLVLGFILSCVLFVSLLEHAFEHPEVLVIYLLWRFVWDMTKQFNEEVKRR